MRLRLLFSEAFRSTTSNLSTTFAATMTVLIGMFLLGLFIALGTWVVSYTDHVKRELLVKVFYDQDATERQISNVIVKLESNDRVREVKFISRGEALRIMQKRAPELTRNLVSNPLPPSIEVKPTKGEDVETVARLVSARVPGVDTVKWGRETASRILSVAKVIWWVFLIAVAVLLVASTLLIANTTRLSIFARRREIEVMKLVGATNWFVRGPFMLEGLLCGLIGSLAAVALLLVGKELALPTVIERLDTTADVQALSFGLIALIIVGVGLLLGALGSGLTLRRFLRV